MKAQLAYRIRVAAAAFLVVLSGATVRAAEGRSNDQIVEFYLQVAFGSEAPYLVDGVSLEEIIRRDQSNLVRVFPVPKFSPPVLEVVETVQRVADDLTARSSDLRIQTYPPDALFAYFQEPSDVREHYADSVIVEVGTRQELIDSMNAEGVSSPAILKIYQAFASVPSNADRPLCLGAVGLRSPNSQILGTAIVWVEYGPQLEECLYEEIMQSFGISNDLPSGAASLFSDDGVYTRPTELDWAIWRIHTDAGILAGMSPDQARTMALEILGEGN